MSASISTVSQLVTVIRSQLAARAPAASARKLDARARQGGRYAEPNLAGLVELRIRQLAPGDPQRGRKAFRVFLEAVLLSHLGEELVNDPRFYQLLDDVQGALEGDAATATLVQDAIAHLLSKND